MLIANGKTIDFDKVIESFKSSIAKESLERNVYEYDIETYLDYFKRLGEAMYGTFTVNDNNRDVYVNLIKWAMGDSTMESVNPSDGKKIGGDINKGIYLAGNTGSGKSAAMIVLNKFCTTLGLRYKKGDRMTNEYGNYLSWASVLAQTYVSRFISGEPIVHSTDPIVCIQDLGAEQAEAIRMGNRVNVLKEIIEQRGDMFNIITHFTSNLKLGGEKLRSMYGDRVESRLYEMCNYLELKGTDWRKA